MRQIEIRALIEEVIIPREIKKKKNEITLKERIFDKKAD